MQTHLVTARPFPRRDFLDIADVAILLDVDGTILDVAATPQGVAVPASLVRTLAELHGRTGGALALVSGRLIENLDRLFVPLKLPCVGGHGVEWRIADGAPIQRRHAELSPLLKTQVTAAVTVDPRIIVEDKGSSLAVHYRLAPELAWISQTYRCIGVENLRKMLCCNSFSKVQESPDADRVYAEAV